MRHFWWGEECRRGRIHWVNWDDLKKLKLQEVWDFEAYSLALLAKLGWRIIRSPHALWVRVLKGIYFPDSSFMHAQRGTKAKWAWSSILEGHGVLKLGTRWNIVNGERTSIWNDKWVPTLPSFQVQSPKHDRCPWNWVSELVVKETNSWNVSLTHSLFSQIERKEICNIPLGLPWQNDELVWYYNRNRHY